MSITTDEMAFLFQWGFGALDQCNRKLKHVESV